MPALRRETRKHRVHDEVDHLRAKIRGLENVVDQLQQDRRADADVIDVQRTRANDAERVAVCALRELEDRTVSHARLAEQVEALQLRLAPYLAAEANANAITVPPAVRDTTALEDQATAPIDVRELRERFTAGLVVSLHHSPLAADPAHIPVPAA
jgi:hypothetical protein